MFGVWLLLAATPAWAGDRESGAAAPAQETGWLRRVVQGRLPDDIGGRPPSQFVRLFPIGSFPEAASFYGTLDQGGSAWEWTDSVVFAPQRVMRGGSMAHRVAKLRASLRSNAAPDRQYGDTGFRLARRVPPSSGGGG